MGCDGMGWDTRSNEERAELLCMYILSENLFPFLVLRSSSFR